MAHSHQGPDPKRMKQYQALQASLVRELFQTERSAEMHGTRDARRLGDSPPSRALLAASAHATEVLKELPALMKRENLPVSHGGRAIGSALSALRQFFADRLLTGERSYRFTLLGFRHGVDVVKSMRRVADASGRVEIGGFCTHWLEEREPLVHDIEQAIGWFVTHPDVATETTATQEIAARLHLVTR
jgi:hypothetical protein